MKKMLCVFLVLPNAFSGLSASVPKVPKEIAKYYTVQATVYSTNPKETDSTPNITASGFRLDPSNPKKHRIIAVSRDLKKSLGFGKRVRIEGAGKHNGEYTVRDVMNKRWTNKIDILINPQDPPISYKDVKVYPL
jgi:3D (Asp-Asp-Asp) domain-containing protein